MSRPPPLPGTPTPTSSSSSSNSYSLHSSQIVRPSPLQTTITSAASGGGATPGPSRPPPVRPPGGSQTPRPPPSRQTPSASGAVSGVLGKGEGKTSGGGTKKEREEKAKRDREEREREKEREKEEKEKEKEREREKEKKKEKMTAAFTAPLRDMMFAFGDDPNPLDETVAVMEDMLGHFIQELCSLPPLPPTHPNASRPRHLTYPLLRDTLSSSRHSAPLLSRLEELAVQQKQFSKARNYGNDEMAEAAELARAEGEDVPLGRPKGVSMGGWGGMGGGGGGAGGTVAAGPKPKKRKVPPQIGEDGEIIKRPRGRPKGSGKKQQAMALAGLL